eukprot:2006698-Pyramimonas_sp.AAC.1
MGASSGASWRRHNVDEEGWLDVACLAHDAQRKGRLRPGPEGGAPRGRCGHVARGRAEQVAGGVG